MNVKPSVLPGVWISKPVRLHDARGYFVETYNMRSAQSFGVMASFVQDNQSLSFKSGAVRGLHFQIPPKPQAKLVRVVRGSIYDVVVDLPIGSPTYGQRTTATLTAHHGEQIYIPRGLAHGFCTLEPNTEVAYKVDEYYAPELEQGLAWDDPTLAIDRPVVPADAVLSDRALKLGSFADYVSPFRYAGR